MPRWAQWLGEALPLMHYLRIVRSFMLKGSTLADLQFDTVAALTLVAMTVAVTRFRRTLDRGRAALKSTHIGRYACA
jgi:ABC-2 type transport system permease protein